ncbi:MAG: hypothetical protein ACO24O_06690 [Arenimonas sp.]
MLRLSDPVVALDFDMAAAWRLQQWLDEREASKYEAMAEAGQPEILTDLLSPT